MCQKTGTNWVKPVKRVEVKSCTSGSLALLCWAHGGETDERGVKSKECLTERRLWSSETSPELGWKRMDQKGSKLHFSSKPKMEAKTLGICDPLCLHLTRKERLSAKTAHDRENGYRDDSSQRGGTLVLTVSQHTDRNPARCSSHAGRRTFCLFKHHFVPHQLFIRYIFPPNWVQHRHRHCHHHYKNYGDISDMLLHTLAFAAAFSKPVAHTEIWKTRSTHTLLSKPNLTKPTL